MEKQWIGLLAVICMLVAGCAYKVGARAAPAGNIYSIHDSKIPGKYALQVTGLDNCCRMEVRPSSYICGAHNFPVNASEAIRWSIQHTLSLVFENIDLNDGQGNVVTISVNRFDPKLRFVPGYWSGQASSTVEIGIDVKGRLCSTLLCLQKEPGTATQVHIARAAQKLSLKLLLRQRERSWKEWPNVYRIIPHCGRRIDVVRGTCLLPPDFSFLPLPISKTGQSGGSLVTAPAECG